MQEKLIGTQNERLFGIPEAAERLGISPWTIRKYLSALRIESVRIGSRRLIRSSELDRVIRDGLHGK